ncbi:hypothetical protein Sta7437_4245 [Stanieria cyanosphaera PCC 7437]|uniref:Replication restart DNA helicase PriA n=1 Tax=Stanieria cyanosphaera (strain ATCC 29371 / PCC 7437) TaxID=111780 RepID=K9XYX9_STAC7|nr:hypothetical protein [Stanieria cyanosphaera]AFZ37718.1 hypothetical protein Sta7437_4245 [Stanieria cyanosphaera PCC 7437]
MNIVVVDRGKKMNKLQIIRCPNCGDLAERSHCTQSRIRRTSCGSCDYLLIQCLDTARVIEAYAPGITADFSASRLKMSATAHKQHQLLNRENTLR